MKSAPRIALFGGTFDPVHEGHVHIARLARQQAHLDEVIFLPCQQSPHKTSATQATAEQRLSMLRLAASEPWMTVDDYETKAPAPSYSYLTLQHFLATRPGTEWFWLMGCDQWLALPRWKHPEILAEHVTFLVFSRDEIPEAREGYRMQHLQGVHPASATVLRDPRHPRHLDPAWLNPAVRQWILQHGLYT